MLDGGPHTLWWSIQNPDGSAPKGPVAEKKSPTTTTPRELQEVVGEEEQEDDDATERLPPPAPVPLLLRALQPTAKLIITLAEPVRRMYSDYYFLIANGVSGRGDRHNFGKSPEDFHLLARSQVADMRRCFMQRAKEVLPSTAVAEKNINGEAARGEDSSGEALSSSLSLADEALWVDPDREPPYADSPSSYSSLPVAAEQACAYDRYHFGRPGTGRIGAGLYHAFLARWFEAGWERDQFLILRLEDFNDDPRGRLEVRISCYS